jgi:hypothetical protein
LHVNDNSQIPKDSKNKLSKVLPMASVFSEHFSKFYNATRELSIDESVIFSKDRVASDTITP